ncbi:ADP-ribose pyrophosphatase YjhB (NUDIX family) [Catenuloplanes nepalensis]|uniref:ADP-ribose pyrophosphatase YjhB (NUDIX family) n=1 Tax=Catenuloplanes nepalensis TaxID=587533 RepID=A0ABT9MSW8_9ACTN|nr:NUDIX hydrolase [Catenuloplanes nepalensis]MDP9794121.1 ADP-ribose pyrophosphatase YjhB (NUDIX family) [Catenuloplanes nepalensis]
MSTWSEPDVFYAQLATFHAMTAALITEPGTGRVLLVKPAYKDAWTWPGGYLDAGEYPHDGCARELTEALGLTIAPGRLLLVDFAPPTAHRRRALISMLFDCGELPPDTTIHLQESELSVWAFFTADEAADRLPAMERYRVTAALHARRNNSTVYLPGSPAER